MEEYSDHVHTWKYFISQIKPRGCTLLKRLDEFPNSILISGCQRSGTTMLSRIVTESEGMVNYWTGIGDDELDAALILSGVMPHKPMGRYCFQTTYLNNCYHEYYQHQEKFKIIWVLRNPYSVVYSMLYNWGKSALNDLYTCCGSHLINDQEKIKVKFLRQFALSKLRRACYAYVGKTRQAFELQQNLSPDQIIFIEYDTLVAEKEDHLPKLYDFLALDYKKEYAEKIHAKSVRKSSKLTDRERLTIQELCEPVYQEAISTLTE